LAASLIKSISCTLLIMRHPLVTGVALVNEALAAAFRMLSLKTNFTVSSKPIVPAASPRSLSPCATRV
jgi:hypothetical protein